MIHKIEQSRLSGALYIPASKSDAQRAILAASLCEGKSEIHNIGTCDDVRTMLACVKQIGATVFENKNSVSITGVSRFPQKASFNCGESGLTFRLIAAICSVNEGVYHLDGKGSLLERNHDFIDKFGIEHGIKIQSKNGKLPYIIRGRFSGKTIVIDSSQTSQFLSGLLMGLPMLKRDVKLTAVNLKSSPYVDMTIDTLQKFGLDIGIDQGYVFTIKSDMKYEPTRYFVEGDWSAASYWFIAAALGHEIKIKGLNTQSLQADRRLIDLFTDNIYDQKGTYKLGKCPLISFDFDATNCPDLFPALVSYAVFCEGVSRIKGVHRLLNKESNRIQTLLSEFTKIGAELRVEDDVLFVRKGELYSSSVHAHGDHRIAMCLAIVGLQLKHGIAISDAEAVDKSYPDFWRDLAELTKKKGPKPRF
ncbi:MAG: 3-phosphoshikimate 1-carboxyvinyltransferase [Cryomorphaceae bacterium]|nr:3-phosphoshikimate 1-carboxyvinyltransferase [Cryomorphaceae bacterium]